MPELPEVETTRRGLEPHLKGRDIVSVVVRQRQLRWPVPGGLPGKLERARILELGRRAKYLLIHTSRGTLIVHLGMSGSLQIVPQSRPLIPHDHLDIGIAGEHCLRFNDPRRFGSVHFTRSGWKDFWLLKGLGPEPLTDAFSGSYLASRCRGRRAAIKTVIMNANVVVGVGNIYASEALFRSGIHPGRAAGRIALPRLEALTQAIKAVLGEAIEQGGTTLRDFTSGEGRPGYFQQRLRVYGREDEPCLNCGQPIRMRRTGQRATYYCPACQR